MKVKLRNNRDSFMVPKNGIVNVTSENNTAYVGEYFDTRKQRIEIVRVRKENCDLVK